MTAAELEPLEARARNGFAHPEDVRALLAEVRLLQKSQDALSDNIMRLTEERARLKEELRSARLTLVSRMEQG